MSEIRHIPLSELQSLIKKGIADSHPLPYWVAAEIGELKVNSSGHCYLELVEKGGDNAIPRARASAVIWRNHWAMIGSYFRSATGAELCAGIRVLVKVSVNYHELYGISLQISDIDPSYTLGDLEAQRRETIARLQKEGIYDMNRELELPTVVQRLAVISSEKAAGYQDFMNELLGNPQRYIYQVQLFAAVMQGRETEESVIAALDAVAGRMDDFDAVVVIRGGGSQSDLAAFNSYRLTSHLAQFPLPVLTGIGHDKDQSVSDLVAHTPLKTPTAVAAFLTARSAVFEAGLDDLAETLAGLVEAHLYRERERINQFEYRLNTLTFKSIHTSSRRLDTALSDLRYRAALCLNRCTNRLELLASKLDGKNPERILEMGYAIVRGSDGKALRSIDNIQTDNLLSIQLQDGTVETQVIRKKHNPES